MLFTAAQMWKLQVFSILLRGLFSIWPNCIPNLGFLQHWAYFQCNKLPNIGKIISSSGHTARDREDDVDWLKTTNLPWA